MRDLNRKILDPQQMSIAFNEVLFNLKYIAPIDIDSFGKIEPSARERIDGKLAYANGVEWNPDGMGTKGYYRWNGAAWVFVG
jgi:hypothetical protein